MGLATSAKRDPYVTTCTEHSSRCESSSVSVFDSQPPISVCRISARLRRPGLAAYGAGIQVFIHLDIFRAIKLHRTEKTWMGLYSKSNTNRTIGRSGRCRFHSGTAEVACIEMNLNPVSSGRWAKPKMIWRTPTHAADRGRGPPQYVSVSTMKRTNEMIAQASSDDTERLGSAIVSCKDQSLPSCARRNFEHCEPKPCGPELGGPLGTC